jgi:hypothetical protein
VRWFLGYGLDESLPDHSTLTRIRERYGLEIFRLFFDEIVERCVETGLVWGRELYFDATKVEANASLESMKTRFAVDEHLCNLFAETDEEPLALDGAQGGDEGSTLESPPTQLPVDPPADLAEQSTGRHDWIAEEGRPAREVRRHGYRRISDFRMSTTDPDATVMRARVGGPLRVGYHVHDAIDGGRARIILKTLVTPSEVMENQVMLSGWEDPAAGPHQIHRGQDRLPS